MPFCASPRNDDLHDILVNSWGQAGLGFVEDAVHRAGLDNPVSDGAQWRSIDVVGSPPLGGVDAVLEQFVLQEIDALRIGELSAVRDWMGPAAQIDAVRNADRALDGQCSRRRYIGRSGEIPEVHIRRRHDAFGVHIDRHINAGGRSSR